MADASDNDDDQLNNNETDDEMADEPEQQPQTESSSEDSWCGSWCGYKGVMFILLMIILLMTIGFWVYSTLGQSGYKNLFGSSDLSYSPAAALMSA
tara:strand:+ start:989 stop:1276 length:288 start_codon:yes stop_codon:yes gene_type:complete